MEFLTIVLLVTGFIISMTTLINGNIENKTKIKKLLAFMYIIILIVGLGKFLIDYRNDKQFKFRLFETLQKSDSIALVQQDSLEIVLDRTSEILFKSISLNIKLDSLNIKTENAISQRQKSQKVFIEQNKLLNKANKLTSIQLKQERPQIDVFTHYFKFIPIDSIKSIIEITFFNLKQRPASRFQHFDLYMYKDLKNDSITNYRLYLGKEDNLTIHKDHPLSAHLPQISIDKLLDITHGSLLFISVKYYDELFDKYYFQDFLFEISVNNNTFSVKLGKPENWQEVKIFMEKNKMKIQY